MNIPNIEQKAAIEHRGGVLLQAGAGSGKTFVLVEHVCYLISSFIAENKALELPQFEDVIKKYLRSIILMTFTKKAVGELSVRLQKRIEREQRTSSYKQQWKLAQKNLGQLFVGTIHSFCLKLISEGHFSEILPPTRIISKDELQVIMEDAFKDFLMQHPWDDPVLKIIRANRNALLSSMTEIFLDASLRMTWKHLTAKEMVDYSFADTLASLLDLQGISDIFKQTRWEITKQDQDKSWATYLLKAARTLSPPRNLADLKAHLDFFQSYSRLPGKRGKDGDELARHFENLKKYRNFLQKNYESFAAYEDAQREVILQWCQWPKKIFSHLSQYYEKRDSATFSDFEYLALKGLQKSEARGKINRQYQHLIVDEFQDTSLVQFEIIRCIINDDLSKLFVVGDIKQAIYRFRGSEVSVFQDAVNRMPRTLELKNNYRSCPNIIAFNNFFFSDIFQQGRGFKGKAKGETSISRQNIPPGIDQRLPGEVEVRVREIIGKEKLTDGEANLLEAQEIIEFLQGLESHTGTTCILYKNLAPSLELLKQMLNQKMSFTAQVKIPFGEAPILIIFYRLIEGYLTNRDRNSTLFLVHGIFHYLHLGTTLNQQELENFYSLLEEIGPYHAYLKLLFEKGISNSLVEGNLSFLRSLLEVCYDDLEHFLLYFKKIRDQSFSFEFQRGNEPEKIQIMTVHASKGLEFDRVVLAGIHTNGRRGQDFRIFGKRPGSFCWKGDEAQKKFYRSPLFILEEQENRYKDFAEDKRLFYVAATRAKQRLTWIDFALLEHSCSAPAQSWIHAFHSELSLATKNLINIKTLPAMKPVRPLANHQRPFFHQNPLGVLPANEASEDLLLLSELSVTGLATLAQCPRKFYMENILKIPPHEAIETSSLFEQSFTPPPLSSAERGREIHLAISRMIQNNLVVPTGKTLNIKLLEWVRGQLQPYQSSLLISERPLKFSLFGLMVSGIPDLIIRHSQSIMIWDFKTGLKQKDNQHYWLQLKLYAFALWQLGQVDQDDPIELSLLYLDTEEKESLTVNFNQTRAEIFSLWQLSNSVHQVNRQHCPLCHYGKLCRF